MKLTGHEKPIHQRRKYKGGKPRPKSVSQRAIAAGLKPDTVRHRLLRGWTLEEALTKPAIPRSKLDRAAVCRHTSAQRKKENQ